MSHVKHSMAAHDQSSGPNVATAVQYRSEVDGIRALAIIPVILYHAGFELFSGGYVGVDVFFVISGYLITTIILSDLEKGKFSVVNFYDRRARRILPALFLVLAASVPFAWFWLVPSDLQDLSRNFIAVSIFGSNIVFWRKQGYFDTASELNPLIHTWSLAVEEQFYVLFPLFLVLTWRLGKKWIVTVLATLSVLSLAVADWGAVNKPSATFFLLPTRAWELGIGSLIAFYFTNQKRTDLPSAVKQWLSIAGVGLIIYSVFAYTKATPFPSVYALAPTGGTALLILYAWPQTYIGKLLSSRPLVVIGLISYSAYLWHQPLFAFARLRVDHPSHSLMASLAVLTLVPSYIAWKFVETPFRNRSWVSRRTVWLFGVAGTCIFIVMGLLGYSSNGFDKRFAFYDKNAEWNQFATSSNGWCLYEGNLPVGNQHANCKIGSARPSINGILFGDSFAAQYEPFWDIVGREARISITVVTATWCYPSNDREFTGPRISRVYDQCLINRRYLAENVASYDVVILGGHWLQVSEQGKMDGVKNLIDAIASKAKLIVLMPSPTIFDSNINVVQQRLQRFGKTFNIHKASKTKDNEALEVNKAMKQLATYYKNVIYIERASIFRANGFPSDLADDGKPFSFDGKHISIHGSKKAAQEFLKSDSYAVLYKSLYQFSALPSETVGGCARCDALGHVSTSAHGTELERVPTK